MVCMAEETDAVEIGQLIKTCIEQTHGRYYTKEEIEVWLDGYMAHNIADAISSKPVLVLKSGNEIVGTVKYDPDQRAIKGLYIHPDFQNMGFGCILVNTLLGLLKSSGVKEVSLSSNRIYMNWYREKFGFKVKKKEYVDWSGIRFEEFRLTKTLVQDATWKSLRPFLFGLQFRNRSRAVTPNRHNT